MVHLIINYSETDSLDYVWFRFGEEIPTNFCEEKEKQGQIQCLQKNKQFAVCEVFTNCVLVYSIMPRGGRAPFGGPSGQTPFLY